MNRAVVCFVLGMCSGLLIGSAHAQGLKPPNSSITFKLCGDNNPNLYFRHPLGTDRLEVRCTNDINKAPDFTIVGCEGPRVKKQSSFYTVTCDRWIQYTPGVPVVK